MATRVADVRTIQRSTGLDVADDKALVLAFQSGEIGAYSDIYEKYRALVSQICFRILQDREEADEAVQETMLRVFRGLPRFNGRYQLQAWVARIATNVSLDMVRARARRPQRDPAKPDISEDPRLIVALTEDTSEVVERVLDQEEVRQTLSSIPDHHREALLLREFEGRSHEEIGDALGLTPQQAKALIHRAKKSFRRAWDRGSERRGVAAFLPWFLIPTVFRRLGGTAQEVASRVSTTPVVTESSVSLADKVTAAAVAAVVVGSAGVGALALKRAHHPLAAPTAKVSAAPSPSPSAVIVLVPPPVRPTHGRARVKPKTRHHVVPVVADPTPGPSDSPSETPSPSPSPGPDPSPSPGPSTSVGPAPAWGLTFTAGTSWVGSCGDCSAAPALISSDVSGTAGQDVSISQVAKGTALDAAGNPAWQVYVEYWGSASGTTGQLQYDFRLETPQGWYTYQGAAALSDSGPMDDGGFLYTFTGGYQSVGGVGATGMPQQGSLQIKLRFWPDGTSLYATDISLFEA